MCCAMCLPHASIKSNNNTNSFLYIVNDVFEFRVTWKFLIFRSSVSGDPLCSLHKNKNVLFTALGETGSNFMENILFRLSV